MVKKARKAVFDGFKVSGAKVERLIGGESRVAVNVCGYSSPQSVIPGTTNCLGPQNGFMTSLPGLDVYSLLTVDLLHEVELGVWKALFTHIVRILHFHSADVVAEFDRRYDKFHCTYLRAVDTGLSIIKPKQVSPCPPIWAERYPPIFKQRLADEGPRGTQL